MRKIILGLALMLMNAGFNQTIAQEAPAYTGMFNIAALYGNNETKFQVQTIHGVTYRGWFAGIGGAIDDYFQQSIPLFADVRKNILNRKNTPFIYADYGLNLVTKGVEETASKTEMKPGIFYEAGAGYKAGLGKRLSLNIAAGFSAKTYEENIYNKKYLPIPPYITDDWILSKKENYTLQRFTMKVGLQF